MGVCPFVFLFSFVKFIPADVSNLCINRSAVCLYASEFIVCVCVSPCASACVYFLECIHAVSIYRCVWHRQTGEPQECSSL